jgi:putative ABC transport system substrate-binding protein
MDRRTALGVLAGGVLLTPLITAAQSEKVWQVAFLTGGARPPDGLPPLALRQALQELGYVEHRNVAYVVRWADARQERLPALAAELVALNVHAIVTVGGPATEAARQATSSIPIVMGLVGDAMSLGLVDSLARPGGNVTGVTDEAVALSAKRLELLKEAVPKAARMAVLYNADDRGMTLRYREVERAAQVLHVTVLSRGVREPDDFETAFQAMVQHRPDALFLVTDALTLLNRKRVIEFTEKHRIPAMFELDALVRDGGLMSYGASPDDNFRRAASTWIGSSRVPPRAPCRSSGRAVTTWPSTSRPRGPWASRCRPRSCSGRIRCWSEAAARVRRRAGRRPRAGRASRAPAWPARRC